MIFLKSLQSTQRDPKEGSWYSSSIVALFCSFHFVSILLLQRCCPYPIEICMLVFTGLYLVFSDHFFNWSVCFCSQFQQILRPFIWYCYQIWYQCSLMHLSSNEWEYWVIGSRPTLKGSSPDEKRKKEIITKKKYCWNRTWFNLPVDSKAALF